MQHAVVGSWSYRLRRRAAIAFLQLVSPLTAETVNIGDRESCPVSLPPRAARPRAYRRSAPPQGMRQGRIPFASFPTGSSRCRAWLGVTLRQHIFADDFDINQTIGIFQCGRHIIPLLRTNREFVGLP